MQRRESHGIQWLCYDLFADCKELVQATFLRRGGVSDGSYRSLNISFEVGDDPRHVQQNVDRVADVLKEEGQLQGRPPLVSGHQVHRDDIVEVSALTSSMIDDCDGLMTTRPGLALMVKHADCQAGIFYDPTHRAVAVAHAGWKGSTLNVFAKTVATMKERYGSHPEDLLVAVSPSLGPESSEFVNYRQELPQSFWDFQIKPNYFDFWEISRQQLEKAGVLPDHIEMAKVDTYSHEEDYYSYRREKVTGRHATLAMLKE